MPVLHSARKGLRCLQSRSWVVVQGEVSAVFAGRCSALVEHHSLSWLNVWTLFVDECGHPDQQRSVIEK